MKKKKKRKWDSEGYEYDFDGANIDNVPSVPRPAWVPAPGEVAKMLKTARITIVLDDGTVKFFKKSAKKNNVGYQQMIREILKQYAEQNQRAA